MVRPQDEFPLLDEYRKHFEITPETIFALYPDIYSNYQLTSDLLVHENTHLTQQQKYGIMEWVREYLDEPQKRLSYELEAYRNQIKSVADRNKAFQLKLHCAEVLASALYGNIISKPEAFKML